MTFLECIPVEDIFENYIFFYHIKLDSVWVYKIRLFLPQSKDDFLICLRIVWASIKMSVKPWLLLKLKLYQLIQFHTQLTLSHAKFYYVLISEHSPMTMYESPAWLLDSIAITSRRSKLTLMWLRTTWSQVTCWDRSQRNLNMTMLTLERLWSETNSPFLSYSPTG